MVLKSMGPQIALCFVLPLEKLMAGQSERILATLVVAMQHTMWVASFISSLLAKYLPTVRINSSREVKNSHTQTFVYIS